MLFVKNVLIIDGPEAIGRKMRTQVGRVCGEGVRFWHQEYLKKQHFGPGARARYGYKPRSKAYSIRKSRAKPGAPDLVWSGLTRKQATRAIFINTRGTRAVGTMIVPSYIKTRPRFRNAPNMANELLATTPDEVRVIGQYIKRRLADVLTSGPVDRKEVRLAS